MGDAIGTSERGDALRVSAATVVAATLVVLFLGYLVKLPCVTGPWDGRQYGKLPCYSDVVPLWYTEGLDRGAFPYVTADNEYPVLTGLTMAVAAVPATDAASFFNWTALLLAGAAVGTALLLHRMAGARALWFALAPTLLVYGFVNWDLLAVLFATFATLAYLRGRDAAAGAWLGLGAAAKLYPGSLAVPFAVGRLRDPGADRAGAVRVAAFAALAWGLVNAPFALTGFARWWRFFEFNAARGADWDSLWYLAQRHLGFTWAVPVLNLLAFGGFVALATTLWVLKSAREPRFPAWSFGFPLLVAFLLTNKVYSPQYSLWLLPWFALAVPNLRLFALFEVFDVGVFLTRFRYFASLDPAIGPGLPFWPFEAFLLLRAATLVACLVWWVRRPAGRLAEGLVAAGPVPADTPVVAGRESAP